MKLKDLDGIVLDKVQLYCDGERKGEYVNIGKLCALYDMPENLLELEVYIIASMVGTLDIKVDKRALELEKEKSTEQEQPIIPEGKAFPKTKKTR